MDEDKIIDISSIIFHLQSFLHKNIELMHIDIREDLTREISDRESVSGTSIKKTLIAWESDPVCSFPDDLHSLSHISEDNHFYQVEEYVLFVFMDS